jgi:hypothetical protein
VVELPIPDWVYRRNQAGKLLGSMRSAIDYAALGEHARVFFAHGVQVTSTEPTAEEAERWSTRYGDGKVANRDIRVGHGATKKGSLNDRQIQNPSKPFEIVPLSRFVPRGFGFVHHSIAILYHEVRNPNLTIRSCFIAVRRAGAPLSAATAPPPPPAARAGTASAAAWSPTRRAWRVAGARRTPPRGASRWSRVRVRLGVGLGLDGWRGACRSWGGGTPIEPSNHVSGRGWVTMLFARTHGLLSTGMGSRAGLSTAADPADVHWTADHMLGSRGSLVEQTLGLTAWMSGWYDDAGDAGALARHENALSQALQLNPERSQVIFDPPHLCSTSLGVI